MNRRHPSSAARAVLLIAAVAAVTSCSTDSNSDVVARVDDTTLTFEDLQTALKGDAVTGEDSAAADQSGLVFAPGDVVRAETTDWIHTQLFTHIGLDKLYETAVSDLGVLCVDRIQSPADTAEVVDALVNEINNTSWAALAQQYTDATGQDDSVPCQPTEGINPAAVAPLAEAAPGEVVAFADPELGYGVLRVRPFDEVNQGEFLTVLNEVRPDEAKKLIESLANAEVEVNPRVGTYSSTSLTVEPLGPNPVDGLTIDPSMAGGTSVETVPVG